MRRRLFPFLLPGFVVATCFVLGEGMVRWLRPQVAIAPRWEASPAYGWIGRPGVVMVHELPGSWRFRYTLNEFGCRGPAVPLETRPDGEEFPSVMQRMLRTGDAVVTWPSEAGGWARRCGATTSSGHSTGRAW